MNIRTCEYMVAIAENGSLAKAAKSLRVSQPALSNFISNLEQQLGYHLFVYKHKTMNLTRAGQIYLDACRKIVEIKNQTYHSILSINNKYSECFTVGVTPHRGSTTFANIYPKFYKRFPNVSIHVKEGYTAALQKELDSGEIDIILGTVAPNSHGNYNIIIDTEDSLQLCVPAFHPLANKASSVHGDFTAIDIRCFQDTPFVMWGEDTVNSLAINGLFDKAGMLPTVVFKSNNMSVIDSMISSGAGVGFLPKSFCRPNQNRVYFALEPPLLIHGGAIYRKKDKLTRAQRYFIYLKLLYTLSSDLFSPAQSEEAKQIYNEFQEMENGYTAD